MHPSAEFTLNSKAVVVLILLVASFQYGDVIYRVLQRFLGNQNHSKTTSTFPGINTISAVIRSWLAPSLVMAVFAGMSGHLDRLLDSPLLFGSNFGISLTPEVPVAHSVPQPPIAASSDMSSNISRPKWLEEEEITNGDIRLIAISSKLWSTEQEANQELLPRAAAIVRADFDQMQNSILSRPSHGLLSDEQLTQFSVKRRYLERIEQDFGTFTAPMCRLWMQIELSPGVRTEIYPAWNAALVGKRILTLGTILSLITLVANAATLFSQLKKAPSRPLLYAGTVAATSAAAWVAGDVFLLVRFAS